MFNLNKNLTKSRNLIFSCLTIILLNSSLLNAGWLDFLSFTFSSTQTKVATVSTAAVKASTEASARILESCSENPVKAGCAIGATAIAGMVALDCVAARLVNRSADERRAWATIIATGAIVGLGAWYKFTSDREAVLKDQINQNFSAIEKGSNEITGEIAGVEKSNTATGTALAGASTTANANGTALTAAQTAAEKNMHATAAAKTSVDSLATSFTELNQTIQKEILDKLQSSGLTLEAALAKVETSNLSSLLSGLGISQADLSRQCTELERQAQETARQVELVKAKFARLAELEAQEQARKTDTADTSGASAASPTATAITGK